MPTKDLRWIYWDSCVFLSYLAKQPERIAVLDAVWNEIAESSDTRILTSILSVTEVSYVADGATELASSASFEEDIEALWNDPLVEVVEFNPAIARLARDLIRRNRLRPGKPKVIDAIHLATAQWVDRFTGRPVAEFHTYDGKLPPYGPEIGLAVCEPHVNQYALPYPLDEKKS